MTFHFLDDLVITLEEPLEKKPTQLKAIQKSPKGFGND